MGNRPSHPLHSATVPYHGRDFVEPFGGSSVFRLRGPWGIAPFNRAYRRWTFTTPLVVFVMYLANRKYKMINFQGLTHRIWSRKRVIPEGKRPVGVDAQEVIAEEDLNGAELWIKVIPFTGRTVEVSVQARNLTVGSCDVHIPTGVIISSLRYTSRNNEVIVFALKKAGQSEDADAVGDHSIYWLRSIQLSGFDNQDNSDDYQLDTYLQNKQIHLKETSETLTAEGAVAKHEIHREIPLPSGVDFATLCKFKISPNIIGFFSLKTQSGLSG